MQKLCGRALSVFAVIFALLFLFHSTFVRANPKPTDTTKSKKTSQSSSGSGAAMKTGKTSDGKFRPTTKKEDEILAAKLRTTLARYSKHSVTTNPDGSMSLIIAPHSLMLSVVTVGADGNLKYDCLKPSALGKKKISQTKTNTEMAEE